VGLALLIYIAVQGLNPSWRYTRNATSWWLVRTANISWLPTGIEAPFGSANAWRQMIIDGSAWLAMCSVWVGFTRRRSGRILLGVLTGQRGRAGRTAGDSAHDREHPVALATDRVHDESGPHRQFRLQQSVPPHISP